MQGIGSGGSLPKVESWPGWTRPRRLNVPKCAAGSLSHMFPISLLILSLHVLLYWKGLLLALQSHKRRLLNFGRSMSDGQVFYIVTVSGGQCLEKTSAGLVDKDASNSDAQRWTLEYGTNENTVAFQNVSNGQYLFASNGAAYGKIDTSIVKQWWTLEEGRSPGSCWWVF